MYQPYELLVNGSTILSSIKVYDIPLGDNGWIYVILYMITITMLAVYTESPANTVIGSIIGGLALFALMPQVSIKVFYAIAVFALTVTLAKYFSHKQGTTI